MALEDEIGAVMKVAIITSVAQASGRILAEALKFNGVEAELFDLKKRDVYDLTGFDSVFSYGTSTDTKHKHRFNPSAAVKNCVSKPRTFDLLKKAGCMTLPYVTNRRDVPKEWEWLVVRENAGGRKAEGMHIIQQGAQEIPNGELFTPYHDHKQEYRIVVFNGAVVGRYFKKEEDGWHFFNNQPAKGFEVMDAHCIRAAKALGIDYVGFDVVAKNKKDFAILEANSAARITDEAENAIVEYYINL